MQRTIYARPIVLGQIKICKESPINFQNVQWRKTVLWCLRWPLISFRDSMLEKDQFLRVKAEWKLITNIESNILSNDATLVVWSRWCWPEFEDRSWYISRSSVYSNHFFVRQIDTWNALSTSMTNAPSLNSFKHRLKQQDLSFHLIGDYKYIIYYSLFHHHLYFHTSSN